MTLPSGWRKSVPSKKKSLRCLQENIAMSLEKHRDVSSKPLGRLFYIIAKTFFPSVPGWLIALFC
jgi:hypothetical protein